MARVCAWERTRLTNLALPAPVVVSAAREVGRPAARPSAYRKACNVSQPCAHYEREVRVDPPLTVCPACVAVDGTWVHLRQCLGCGTTACCDLSPRRHATAHFRETGHPMIRTAEPSEDWRWCYRDDRLYQPGSAV